MVYSLAADLVVLLHLLFVVFVVAGGLLVLRRPRLVWLHLPCALWGALLEVYRWGCPLTPLEKALRRAAGEGQYAGGFIAHHLVPLLYPAGLTRSHQLALAMAVVVVNVVLYAFIARRHGPVPWRWR